VRSWLIAQSIRQSVVTWRGRFHYSRLRARYAQLYRECADQAWRPAADRLFVLATPFRGFARDGLFRTTSLAAVRKPWLHASGAGDGCAGNSSNVAAARLGSAKPRTHFSDAFSVVMSWLSSRLDPWKAKKEERQI
jgi:hypothetical protein